MSRLVVTLVALLLLGTIMAVSFQISLASGGDAREVVNETFTPAAAGDHAELEQSNRDDVVYERPREIQVYNSSTGNTEEMIEGTDYDWERSNGTVQTLAGGDLDGEPSASVTYKYRIISDAQRDFAFMLSQLPFVLALAGPFLVAVWFLRLIG